MCICMYVCVLSHIATYDPAPSRPQSMYAFMYVYIHIHTHTHTHIHTWAHINLHTYIPTLIHAYIHTGGSFTITSTPTIKLQEGTNHYVYICVCIYIHTHSRPHTPTHTHIHTDRQVVLSRSPQHLRSSCRKAQIPTCV